MRMNGAEITVHLLQRQGIHTLSGIPGGANLPIYDALSRNGHIRHILTRHEQGAGFIAQGMARATGRPQVCLATSGPGVTNILTAVADAKLDSIPVVCITGQVPSAMIGSDAFQEVDTYGISIPVTKHNYLVRDASALLEIIPEAFRIAMSGRPGPVWIDVPRDIQTQEVAFGHWPEPGRPVPPPGIDRDDIQQAAALINAAHRPVLYLGGGVVQSGAGPMPLRFVEKGSIPTAMTLMGLGGVPADHPLSMGMLGMHGAPYTNLALEECDLLIAAGVRFDDRATGKVRQFCPRAGILHVDIDPSELDKIKTADLGIVGDLRTFMETLLPMIEERKRREWTERIAELKERHPLRLPGSGDLRTPYGLITKVAGLLDDETLIATDVGQHQMWVAQAYPVRRPGQLLTSGGLGTMGFGLPAAIGAALAFPEKQVVCFSGDGSLMMNIQELQTAVEQDVNVKVIVMDNNALGLVHQQQDLFYDKRFYASDFKRRTDFVRIARGFGLKAYDLSEDDRPSSLLARALEEPGPCLIHTRVDIKEGVYPMVPPGAANREMIGGESYADKRFE